MIHLSIQTVEKKDNFTIFEDKKVIFSANLSEIGFSSDNLSLDISNALKGNNLKAKDLEFITLVVGPGSFTGIKSGLAFAKGLSYALKCPIVAVSSLETLANEVKIEGKIVAMIDARNERVYAEVFTFDGKDLISLSPCFVDDIKQVLKNNPKAVVIGSGAINNKDLLNEFRDIKLIEKQEVNSTTSGLIGLEKFKSKEFFDTYNIEPLYISEPRITY